MIELQFLDRARAARFFSRSSATRVLAPTISGWRVSPVDKRPQRVERRETDQRRRKNAEADEDQVLGAGATNDEYRRRRAHERTEREELPRPQ